MAMLQFGGTMCNVVTRFAPRTIWRINSQQLLTLSSSAAPVPDIASIVDKQPKKPVQQQTSTKQSKPKLKSENKLVEAAFAAILNDTKTVADRSSKSSIRKDISEANTIDKLLSIAGNEKISQRDGLNIMSILSEWINAKTITPADFEKDPRFLSLCKQLAGQAEQSTISKPHEHGDLKTVLSLAGDDEAAKLISTLSLAQMTQVLTTLAHKRRRSLPILRSLSYHISRSTEKMNVKECADILFSLAVLNFPDEVLMEKVSSELIIRIPENNGTAVIGSVVTSLGFLRYKNTELLDALCEWILAEPRSLKPQYITSLLLTLATVLHIPFNMTELQKAFIKPLKETDVSASEVWLDVVWATVILGIADPVQVACTLDSVFIQKLTDLQCLTMPRKVKLLNVNAAAKLLIPNYTGPFLNEDLNSHETFINRPKEKQLYVTSVHDTLSNLFASSTCLKINENTGMGFIIDAECYVDDKCNPLPIGQAAKHSNATRLAVISLYYNDFCRGVQECVGLYSLIIRLLQAKGYKVVLVPYTEFNPQDKLVTRVKYLKEKIRLTVQSSST
ncbi:FAST kinase domain-containing protein 4 isoform X1 [Neodiprion virginianus]|uniref:FAST kinase domain-containing protein 4 isoform X1 n=1 Tax=Neodiprion fabricii TaxID=2872261 RepID=UPI001ED932B1|nr:FAST kinase domain-containing protein 4 isoform X1 [Neodiprion fabricii]XP_046629670.1 FAST kinase domain-containing protein 4 isoform X1 [Neodiprion virginianus]